MIFWVPVDDLEIMQTIECGGIEMMIYIQEFGVYCYIPLDANKKG